MSWHVDDLYHSGQNEHVHLDECVCGWRGSSSDPWSCCVVTVTKRWINDQKTTIQTWEGGVSGVIWGLSRLESSPIRQLDPCLPFDLQLQLVQWPFPDVAWDSSRQRHFCRFLTSSGSRWMNSKTLFLCRRSSVASPVNLSIFICSSHFLLTPTQTFGPSFYDSCVHVDSPNTCSYGRQTQMENQYEQCESGKMCNILCWFQVERRWFSSVLLFSQSGPQVTKCLLVVSVTRKRTLTQHDWTF